MRLDHLIANNREANIGTKVRATSREAPTAKLMVKINSLNSNEINPPMNKNGKTEIKLAAVEAINDDSTSWEEAIAVSIIRSGVNLVKLDLPKVFSVLTAIFSKITTEVSIACPIPSAKPPKLNTFKDRLNCFIKISAARVHRGIDNEIMNACRNEPRNNNTATAANKAPETAALVTSAKELRINFDSSNVGVRVASRGIKPDCCSSSNRFLTLSTTLTVFASGCFWTLTFTDSSPFNKTYIRWFSAPSITSAKSRR